MTSANIAPFPLNPDYEKVLERKVVSELCHLGLIDTMMLYIQETLPSKLKKIKLPPLQVDLTFDSHRGFFLIYLVTKPQAFGMPMVFESPCARSALVGAACWLCRIKPIQKGETRPVQGLTPEYIEPMDCFRSEDKK